MKLFGCYTGTSDWNPSGDSARNANWAAAVRQFSKNVGRDVNCANVFPCWGSMQWWGVNCGGIAQGVASAFGTSFVPVVGFKMISQRVAEDCPPNGYAWNDAKGYADASAGKWDASWRAAVQQFAAKGFKYLMARIAYEQNGSFMEDFEGWDAATQAAWRAGFEHVAGVLHDEAAKQGIRVDVMFNPDVMGNCPDVPGTAPNPATWDILGVDIYNGFWGEGDVSSADVRRAYWDNPKGGFGMKAAIAYAKSVGKPIFFPECGSGLSSNGTAHGIANDPAFWPWLGGSVQSMRSQGVKFYGLCAWDINPSDGGWRFADGSQPQCLADFKASLATFVGDEIGGVASASAPAPQPVPAPAPAPSTPVPAPASPAPPPVPAPAPSVLSSVTVGQAGRFGRDRLVLQVCEDAYQGHAQFTVSIDGRQVGGVQTAGASRAANQTQPFVIQGGFGGGQHTVVVNFLNDAWDGASATNDRNLYVVGATINDAPIPGAGLTMLSAGGQSFNFQRPR